MQFSARITLAELIDISAVLLVNDVKSITVHSRAHTSVLCTFVYVELIFVVLTTEWDVVWWHGTAHEHGTGRPPSSHIELCCVPSLLICFCHVMQLMCWTVDTWRWRWPLVDTLLICVDMWGVLCAWRQLHCEWCHSQMMLHVLPVSALESFVMARSGRRFRGENPSRIGAVK